MVSTTIKFKTIYSTSIEVEITGTFTIIENQYLRSWHWNEQLIVGNPRDNSMNVKKNNNFCRIAKEMNN